MSSFTEPHVVPNLYEFLYSLEHKTNGRMLVTKQLPVPADLPSIETNSEEVNGYQQLFVYPLFSKYLLFWGG